MTNTLAALEHFAERERHKGYTVIEIASPLALEISRFYRSVSEDYVAGPDGTDPEHTEAELWVEMCLI
jgi:hypothetical protein